VNPYIDLLNFTFEKKPVFLVVAGTHDSNLPLLSNRSTFNVNNIQLSSLTEKESLDFCEEYQSI